LFGCFPQVQAAQSLPGDTVFPHDFLFSPTPLLLVKICQLFLDYIQVLCHYCLIS
jgi:hypothetical protein